MKHHWAKVFVPPHQVLLYENKTSHHAEPQQKSKKAKDNDKHNTFLFKCSTWKIKRTFLLVSTRKTTQKDQY